MKKILSLALLLMGFAVLCTGCAEETFPEESVATSDQVGNSPFAAEGVTSSIATIVMTNHVGASEHIDFGYPCIFGATDRLIGEVLPTSGNMPGGNPYYDRWQWYMYHESSALASNSWGPYLIYMDYYQFIKTANDVISIAGSSEDNAEMRGVGKAWRALFYLDMARIYDPLPAKAPNNSSYETELNEVLELTVPKVTENSTLDELRNNPRMTREEIFTFIFEDLDDAEACLTEYAAPTKAFPTLAVVYGLKARAYLWLGGFDKQYEGFPTGTEAYRKAAEYARKAINASGATLMTESQWLDPKSGFNTAVSSWMWALLQSTDTVLGNLHSWAAHMCVNAIWGYGTGAQPGMQALFYPRIHANDFRRKVIVTPDRDFSAIEPYTTLTEAEFEEWSIAPYANLKFKTRDGEKNNYTVGNVVDIPLMRVEEMYFIEAEATAHYDAATGRDLLNSFMANRAPGYSAPMANDLVDEIIFQKRVEFWGEGILYYDFKRLNMSMHAGDPGSNSPGQTRFSTDGRAPWWNMVLPLTAIQQNAGITKNNPSPSGTVLSND